MSDADLDALEAAIEEVSDALASDPKNRELAAELKRLLQKNEDYIISNIYRR